MSIGKIVSNVMINSTILFINFSVRYFIICVWGVCVCGCVCKYPLKSEILGISGAGITGGCVLPDMGPGSRI